MSDEEPVFVAPVPVRLPSPQRTLDALARRDDVAPRASAPVSSTTTPGQQYALAAAAAASQSSEASVRSTSRVRGGDAPSVSFGRVDVREMGAHVRMSSTGTYRLGLDWNIIQDVSRNLDTWEAERERTRVHRGRNLAMGLKGQAAIRAALNGGDEPVAAAAGPLRAVENWHVKQDGRVYQRDGEHSSVIADVDGRIVTTQSGSRYLLGRLDPAIAAVMRMTGAEYDEDAPMDNLRALLYAEKIVFGAAARTAAKLRDALSLLESQLDAPELTEHHFGVIRHVFHQIGLDMSGPREDATMTPIPPPPSTGSRSGSARATQRAFGSPQ